MVKCTWWCMVGSGSRWLGLVVWGDMDCFLREEWIGGGCVGGCVGGR